MTRTWRNIGGMHHWQPYRAPYSALQLGAALCGKHPAQLGGTLHRLRNVGQMARCVLLQRSDFLLHLGPPIEQGAICIAGDSGSGRLSSGLVLACSAGDLGLDSSKPLRQQQHRLLFFAAQVARGESQAFGRFLLGPALDVAVAQQLVHPPESSIGGHLGPGRRLLIACMTAPRTMSIPSCGWQPTAVNNRVSGW